LHKSTYANSKKKNKKLRKLLFYVDQNTKQGIKKRERVFKYDEYVEEGAPANAPDWTISGYTGPLKNLTNKAISKYFTD
jgi:hypothetical protein